MAVKDPLPPGRGLAPASIRAALCAAMTDDPEPRGFRAWRKAADARVRRANQADMSNVVPLRRPKAPERPRFTLRPNALVYWTAISAILIVVYLLRPFF